MNKDHATDQLQFVFNFSFLQLTMSRLIVLGMILTKKKTLSVGLCNACYCCMYLQKLFSCVCSTYLLSFPLGIRCT